jgi:hypothetical protein
MKLSKLLLAVAGATVLLGALVATASAGRLEHSSTDSRATWTHMIFRGGIGNFDCEVRLEGRLHTRSTTKTINSLIGYITAGTVIRCAAFGVTVNQASLPWHRRFGGFTGTLPNIIGVSETVTGAEWNIREPTFGITCTISRANSSTILSYAVSGGTVASASVSGSSRCGSFEATLAGTTTNVENRAGARVTITLI